MDDVAGFSTKIYFIEVFWHGTLFSENFLTRSAKWQCFYEKIIWLRHAEVTMFLREWHFHADVALFSQGSHVLTSFSLESHCWCGLVLVRKSCTDVILARNILGEDVLTWHHSREKHLCCWHHYCKKFVSWRVTILVRKSCANITLTRKSLANVSPFSRECCVLTSLSQECH